MRICCLCSGRGERLRPLSDKYYKPLVPVPSSGLPVTVPNLAHSLSQIVKYFKDETFKIYVVSCQEFFETAEWFQTEASLLDTRVSVIEVVNPYDNKLYNNVTSVKTFFKELGSSYQDDDVMFIEGDVYLESVKFLDEFVRSQSTYFCEYRQNEWVFVRETEGPYKVVKGADGLAMAGISYVKRDDIHSLMKELVKANETEFWDESLVRAHLDLKLINARSDCIKEYDTIDDLIKLGVAEHDIAGMISDDGIATRTSSMTNSSFIISNNGKRSVIRFNGSGTDTFINRKREIACTEYAVKSGLTPHTEFVNGVKISDYVENSRTMTGSPQDLEDAISLIKDFHRIIPEKYDLLVDLIKEINQYMSLVDFSLLSNSLPIRSEFIKMTQVVRNYIIEHQHDDLVFSHRDLDPRNVLITPKKSYLLDFEYSGLLNQYWDWGALVSEQELYFSTDPEEIFNIMERHLDTFSKKEVLEWSVVVDYVWSIWTLAKMSLGEDYLDYFNQRWDRACRVAKEVGMT